MSKPKLEVPLTSPQEMMPGNVKRAMKAVDASRRDQYWLTRDKIVIKPGFNVREKDDAYWAHVRSIADSMRAEGFLVEHPLGGFIERVGDADQIVLTDGHCRVDAIDILIKEGIDLGEFPMAIKSNATSLEDLTVALVKTNNGKPLTPYETGVVCKRCQGFGWDEKKIADRLGFTETYVKDLLTLMGSPMEIRRMVQTGTVSANTALQTMRKHGSEAVAKLKDAEAKVKASGKKKVTAKHVTSANPVEKLAKKHALKLLEALRWVKDDPSFAKLHEATQKEVNSVLTPFPEEKQE